MLSWFVHELVQMPSTNELDWNCFSCFYQAIVVYLSQFSRDRPIVPGIPFEGASALAM